MEDYLRLIGGHMSLAEALAQPGADFDFTPPRVRHRDLQAGRSLLMFLLDTNVISELRSSSSAAIKARTKVAENVPRLSLLVIEASVSAKPCFDPDNIGGPAPSPQRLRKIIHIGMDAFYASVEQRDIPDLRGKPVAVGGSRERGVLGAASYEARKFGIRSVMPSITACRQCPDLIFVEPRFDVYREVSLQIRGIFCRTYRGHRIAVAR